MSTHKKAYLPPVLTIHGDVRTITLSHMPNHNPPGNAFGLSCGNGNVHGPSDCGINGDANGHEDSGQGAGQRG